MDEQVTVNVECGKPPFTVVPNFIITDTTLLCETRMVFIYLFSKANMPKKWQVHPTDIQSMFGFKRHTWLKVSKELKERGYLVEKKIYKGTILTFTWDWAKLSTTPVDKPVDKSTKNDDFTGVDFHTVRNDTCVKTDGITKKERTTKERSDLQTKEQAKVVSSDEEIRAKVSRKLRNQGITQGLLRLINEITYHVVNRKQDKLTEAHAINAACSLVVAGKWTTPYNLAAEESKRLENDFTEFKAAEREDAKKLFSILGEALRPKN